MYRQLEVAVLAELQAAPGPQPQQLDVARIRQLYRRQLSTPLYGNDELIGEYLEWEEATGNDVELEEDVDDEDDDDDDDEVMEKELSFKYWKPVVAAQMEMLAERYEWEVKLAAPEAGSRVSIAAEKRDGDLSGTGSPELLRVWSEYVAFEVGKSRRKHPELAVCLFERCLSELFLAPQLWCEYVRFLQDQQGMGRPVNVEAVAERALRNCPYSLELQRARLMAIEAAGGEAVEERYEGAVLSALQSQLESDAAYASVALEACAFYRRRLGSDEHSLERTRHAISRALTYAERGKPGPMWQVRLEVHQFWADFERYHGNNMKQAIAAWRSLLALLGGQDVTARSRLIDCLVAVGDYASAAKEYRELVDACPARKLAQFGSSWISFEMQFGDLGSYQRASRRVAQRTHEYHAELQRQEASKPAADANKSKKRKRKADNGDVEQSKRQKRADLAKAQEHAAVEEKRTVFLVGLPFHIKWEEIAELLDPYGKPTSIRFGRGRLFAYVDMETPEQAAKAVEALDRTMLKDKRLKAQISLPKSEVAAAAAKAAQHAKSDDETRRARTVFIQGLPRGEHVEEWSDALRGAMEQFGDLSRVNVVPQDGQSQACKGFAYVEFEQPEHAQDAIAQGTLDVGSKDQSVTLHKALSKQDVAKAKNKTKRQPRRGQEPHKRRRIAVPKRGQAQAGAGSGESGSGQAAKPKSNADFRKMLGL